MPLTIAHPAAVIPLQRLLRQWAVPSALVVGSVAPDLAYILPIGVSRSASHSVGALLWFCLPVGYAVYIVYHLLLKLPLISLLPTDVACRLTTVTGGGRRLPAGSWWAVPASVLLGAGTHLAWDAFTHEEAPAVRAFGFLRAQLFSVGAYRLFVYKILQHGSTLMGILILGWWITEWSRKTAVAAAPAASLTPSERFTAVSMLIGIPAAYGLMSGISNLSAPMTTSALQAAVGRAVLSFFAAVGIGTLVFSVSWHLWLSRSNPPSQPTPQSGRG
jgi:uncharacterized protein DUF4184